MEVGQEVPTGYDEGLAAHGEDDLHGAPFAQAELAAAVDGVAEFGYEDAGEPEDAGGCDEVGDDLEFVEHGD